MTKQKPGKMQLDKRVGGNIRTERERRGISRERLAEMLDLTVSHLGLIERGERGATALTLEKLSQILGVSVDALIRKPDEQDCPPEENPAAGKILSIVSGFDDEEMEFVIKFMQEFAMLRQGRRSKGIAETEADVR